MTKHRTLAIALAFALVPFGSLLGAKLVHAEAVEVPLGLVQKQCNILAITAEAVAKDRDNGVPMSTVLDLAVQLDDVVIRRSVVTTVLKVYDAHHQSPIQASEYIFAECLHYYGH